MSKLNSKTLTIAATLLMVLALLVMATPLLRSSAGFASGRTGINRPFVFQGTPVPGQNGQGFVIQGTPFPEGTTPQGQVNPNFPTTGRQFQGGQGISFLSLGFLSGVMGTVVYAIALLVSLAAALGMFLTKRWGKILGIVMAVLYGILALISLVPTLLMSFAFRAGNPLSIGLNVLHLVLAIAIIVLASIQAKKVANPITPVAPPASPA